MNSIKKCLASFALGLLGAAGAQGQVMLLPMDPGTLDTSFASSSGATAAMIDFVNQEAFAVDIFWIDYAGNRVFYNTLDANSSFYQPTFLTHPWIAVAYGSGDTPAQGTGTLLAGFLPLTANPNQLLSLADTATIAPTVSAVPEPSAAMLMLAGGLGLAGIVALRRRRSNAA